jgi:DNA-binding CsgD family transcriptional regulator
VSRRIIRINKRLVKELDLTVVERRGLCWAMTSFGIDAYKASEKDLLAESVNLHKASEEEA